MHCQLCTVECSTLWSIVEQGGVLWSTLWSTLWSADHHCGALWGKVECCGALWSTLWSAVALWIGKDCATALISDHTHSWYNNYLPGDSHGSLLWMWNRKTMFWAVWLVQLGNHPNQNCDLESAQIFSPKVLFVGTLIHSSKAPLESRHLSLLEVFCKELACRLLQVDC